MAFPRRAGILLHPTSLPGGHGIGDLGRSAYVFVDMLERAGMGLWQVLPLGPTGAANSPYQALSSHAGSPLLISLDELVSDGLLTRAELSATTFGEGPVHYDRVREFKERSLRTAFARLRAGSNTEELHESFDAFVEEEAAWLDDFALFVALKIAFDGKPWFAWPDTELVTRDLGALKNARQKNADEVAFQQFMQFVFFRQWRALRTYANERSVQLMGDVPIYVAHDSSDVWSSPQYFNLDEQGEAQSVAGVPPDYFSATGQLWGNPIYRWDVLKKEGYAWWIERIRATLALVDLLRIDHFRGFAAYWEVPAGEKTAVNGQWITGPGADFFETLRDTLGELPIVAEDLGVITKDVDELRLEQRMPGMKVLQFAFCDGAELYLPHTYETNCVVYTATHDNDTTRGWYEATGPDYADHDRGAIERERDKARRYMARGGDDFAMHLVRLAFASVADTAVVPVQDVLGLGNDCRMNRPGITEGQWTWRLTQKQLEAIPAGTLREFVDLYGRAPAAP